MLTLSRVFFLVCWVLVLPACQYAPPLGYAESADVVQKRDVLTGHLLELMPEEKRGVAAVQQEAQWLADTAYKASAAIARYNDPVLPGWLNNRMVNSSFNLQERGLCWHYAHDLYRELRRRKLLYYRIGECVRDPGKGSEHHCVYLTAQGSQLPQAIILDAWRYNGRLKLIEGETILDEGWMDEPGTIAMLARTYPECHRYPLEHWARVKSGKKWNDYVYSWSPEGVESRQGVLMRRNMERGLKERGGKLVDY